MDSKITRSFTKKSEKLTESLPRAREGGLVGVLE